jgi:hypothetical protein
MLFPRLTPRDSFLRFLGPKPGKTGLGSEDDFEVKKMSLDDGENHGGERIVKILEGEGAIDVGICVSRWFGGSCGHQCAGTILLTSPLVLGPQVNFWDPFASRTSKTSLVLLLLNSEMSKRPPQRLKRSKTCLARSKNATSALPTCAKSSVSLHKKIRIIQI